MKKTDPLVDLHVLITVVHISAKSRLLVRITYHSFDEEANGFSIPLSVMFAVTFIL